MKNQSAAVVRAVRKYHRITQEEFAHMIGITQGAQSKIEADILELSAVQWVVICERFEIDPHSLVTGRVEVLDRKKVKLTHGQERFGSFKLPRKYSDYMGSTVRSVFPLIRFMEMKLGPEKRNALLKELKMDPDYFTIMSNPINLVFVQDLVELLVKAGQLNPNDLDEIANIVPPNEAHEYALSDIESRNGLATMKRFVDKINKLYEVNSIYEFVGEKGLLLRARDEAYVKELGLTQEFQQFRMNYNKANLESLRTHLKAGIGPLEVHPVSGGWDITHVA